MTKLHDVVTRAEADDELADTSKTMRPWSDWTPQDALLRTIGKGMLCLIQRIRQQSQHTRCVKAANLQRVGGTMDGVKVAASSPPNRVHGARARLEAAHKAHHDRYTPPSSQHYLIQSAAIVSRIAD